MSYDANYTAPDRKNEAFQELLGYLGGIALPHSRVSFLSWQNAFQKLF